MTLYFGSKEAGIIWEGDKEVGIRWEGSKESFNAEAPLATLNLNLTVAQGGAGRTDFRGFFARLFGSINPGRSIFGNASISAIYWPGIGGIVVQFYADPITAPTSIKVGDNTYPLRRAGGNAGINTFNTVQQFNASPFPAVGETVAIELAGLPAVFGLPITCRDITEAYNAVANGIGNFDANGVVLRFAHNGQTYVVRAIFTHANGHQFRFHDNAQALAFIAADFTIDSGIAGQQTYKSSVMDNIPSIVAAQYRAFPGRYAANTEYTVTISE